MNKCLITLCMLTFLSFIQAAEADTVDARCDIYPKGQDKASATLACQFSQRQGNVSIQRADGVRYEFEAQNRPGNFLDQDRRAVYRKKGLGDKGLIFATAKETIYVYWDASGLTQQPTAADESRKAATSLLNLSPIAVPINLELEASGIRFKVESANNPSGALVKLTPSGLEIDNSPQEEKVSGQVSGADVGDLDRDGSPEIYVFVRGTEAPHIASLLAFSANRRKSLSQIFLPDLTADSALADGYRGYDQFAVVENHLVRRFPVFAKGADDRQPNSVRQIAYKLKAGEASWQLIVDKVNAY